MKVSDEDGFLVRSMTLTSNNTTVRERIPIDRVAQRDRVAALHPDNGAPLHDERIITVREEPRLHVRMSKKSSLNHGCDPSSQVLLGKSTHIENRDVGGTFVLWSGTVHDILYW